MFQLQLFLASRLLNQLGCPAEATMEMELKCTSRTGPYVAHDVLSPNTHEQGVAVEYNAHNKQDQTATGAGKSTRSENEVRNIMYKYHILVLQYIRTTRLRGVLNHHMFASPLQPAD